VRQPLIRPTLQGKVTEAKSGDDAINAYVKISKNGVLIKAVPTDFEGLFVTNLPSGTYDIEVSYVGMGIKNIKNVMLWEGINVNLAIQLEEDPEFSSDFGCLREYKIPLMQMDDTSSGARYSSAQIGRSPR
jgi:hypothetical protein